MDTRSSRGGRQRHVEPPADADAVRAQWQKHLQDYVDGTLDDELALRLHLDAQKIPALQADLDRMRALFSALDETPRAEPGPDFDRRVLEDLPYEFYASAPRRAPKVLLLGEENPTVLSRVLLWTQRTSLGLLALHLALWVLGGTPVLRPLASAGRWVGEGLRSFGSAEGGGNPMVGVVAFLSGIYDGVAASLGQMASGQGPLWLPSLALAVAVVSTAGLYLRFQRSRDAEPGRVSS